MSEDEQFCYDICQAARRMHIYCRMDKSGDLFIVTFFDVMASSKIAGELLESKEAAMKSACEKLVEYLKFK